MVKYLRIYKYLGSEVDISKKKLISKSLITIIVVQLLTIVIPGINRDRSEKKQRQVKRTETGI
jgi:hypothetical protein